MPNQVPSVLAMAYHDDIAKLRDMARNQIERDCVDEMEACLQASKYPDEHLMSISWKMIQREQAVNRYGQ